MIINRGVGEAQQSGDCACLILANDAIYKGRLKYSNVLRVVTKCNFWKLFDWIKLFNYNFIKIVNSLAYFYWKKYSLFCHIAELGTLYTSMGVFALCCIAAHGY